MGNMPLIDKRTANARRPANHRSLTTADRDNQIDISAVELTVPQDVPR
jgi:hypothetical protein